jgi:hypothetical protein
MMTRAALRMIGMGLVLCGAVTASARADDAPKAAPRAGAQSRCISENDGWVRKGRRVDFAIELTNKCEQRLKCRVFAYVTSAKGAAQGRGTLVLAPAAKGQATKKTWTMRVKMSGGSAQTARECRI